MQFNVMPRTKVRYDKRYDKRFIENTTVYEETLAGLMTHQHKSYQ